VVLKRNDNDTGITREALVTFDLLLEKRIETDFLDFTLRAGIKNLTEAEDHYLYGEETYELDALGRTYWIEAEVSF
jgi:outer membrane receptor protein involved in Fe transport